MPTDGVTECAGGFFISAAWRSSGKTIFSIGLSRAAKRRNITIQTFKKGPDYIDPLWLAAASGKGCYNLDPYIQQNNQWLDTFNNNVDRHSLAIIEGTMGLHDGLQSDGSDSNAAVAHALGLPVVLVVDCRGMHRTVAALINGIQQFDPGVRFAGVVLNRIRSSRHEGKIRTALEQHSDTQLLGCIPESHHVHIDEKQLGLTPVTECALLNNCIDTAADLVTEHCDLDSLLINHGVVQSDESLTQNSGADSDSFDKTFQYKIGVARDEAFHFYYQDDIDALIDHGIELVEVSPVNDEFPEDLDGLLIGGGFPERHAKALASNHRFLKGLRQSIENGLTVHAECAGLMYLCKRFVLESGSFDMLGVIEAEVHMCEKPQGRGYMKLQLRQNTGDSGDLYRHEADIRAHEFHHSRVCFENSPAYLFDVKRGYGINGQSDGVKIKNVHASFAHFRQTREHQWVNEFIKQVVENSDHGFSAVQTQ